MKSSKFAAGALGIISVLVLGLAIFFYASADSIEAAAFETNLRLHATRIGLCSDSCITEWLSKYHGEAPGLEVARTFVAFGMTNTDLFLQILSSIPPTARAALAERIIFAVTDSAWQSRFREAFRFDIEILLTKIE